MTGAKAHVLVVGDVILDRYWFGAVSRISPEAPVPVVHVQREELRPGGAANVAANIMALNGQAILIGIVGPDETGDKLVDVLLQRGVTVQFHIDQSLPTTVKLRIIGQHQQMLRVDFEQKPDTTWRTVRDADFSTHLPVADVVVLSDYGKGVLADCGSLIVTARAAGKVVIVDPKGRDWERYRGASLVSPNRAELREMVGDWDSEDDLTVKAQALRAQYDFDALLVTRSEEGMTLFDADGRHHAATQAREVYDVSGAGDTVIATMALMLAEGKSMGDAMAIANRAASIVVGKFGTATCSRAELFGG